MVGVGRAFNRYAKHLTQFSLKETGGGDEVAEGGNDGRLPVNHHPQRQNGRAFAKMVQDLHLARFYTKIQPRYRGEVAPACFLEGVDGRIQISGRNDHIQPVRRGGVLFGRPVFQEGFGRKQNTLTIHIHLPNNFFYIRGGIL